MRYCSAVSRTERLRTREVMVGEVGIGGGNPIRIQSMTTSETDHVDETVEQILRLEDVGCEIARVTVQRELEAVACERIKSKLISRGSRIPLVADIHFNRKAAEVVAGFVDKVRINPGNYSDPRATFKNLSFDKNEYQLELNRIEDLFTPLVEICKARKISMRIGTNHGSLSDRIMCWYGDGPSGMVESAFEYVQICRKLNYHDLIFSMKSSNTRIMIEAYRLLAAEQIHRGWDYPIHLGVTEAGADEDGRIKSALGIGSLLVDGIGDTVRVSLAEDPWEEIEPCRELVSLANEYRNYRGEEFDESFREGHTLKARNVLSVSPCRLDPRGSVVVRLDSDDLTNADLARLLGCIKNEGQWVRTRVSTVDVVVIDIDRDLEAVEREAIRRVISTGIDIVFSRKNRDDSAALGAEFESVLSGSIVVFDDDNWDFEPLKKAPQSLVFLRLSGDRVHRARHFFEMLHINSIDSPVVLEFTYTSSSPFSVMKSSTEYGSLLVDGLGDGVCISFDGPIDERARLGFKILQAARRRFSRTEYIECPECGRSLFDLQTVRKEVERRTGHLVGVVIAVMGCIVNGPGEMADADFGYVGSKPGKVDLYVGKNAHMRGIDAHQAADRLVEMIKAHGKWSEPGEAVELVFPLVVS